MSTVYDYLKYFFTKRQYTVSFTKPLILKINGGQIEYSRFGSGDPLILIMGYAGSMNGWDIRFLDELAKSNEVIVFNNRNTGKSAFTPALYTVEDMAQDVEQLRIGLNLNQVSVCGISMGGIIAQQYAYMYPNKLKSVTLINSLPPGKLIVMPNNGIQEILRDLPNGKFITYWKMINILFPSIWQATALGVFHYKPEGTSNVIPASTIIEQQYVIEKWGELPDPEGHLKAISTPTQILTGIKDYLIPPANSNVLNRYLANSVLYEYEKGGHIMIYQEPVKIANDINIFIKSVN